MEKQCKGKSNDNMMVDYCWFLQKQSKTKCVLFCKRQKTFYLCYYIFPINSFNFKQTDKQK